MTPIATDRSSIYKLSKTLPRFIQKWVFNAIFWLIWKHRFLTQTRNVIYFYSLSKVSLLIYQLKKIYSNGYNLSETPSVTDQVKWILSNILCSRKMDSPSITHNSTEHFSQFHTRSASEKNIGCVESWPPLVQLLSRWFSFSLRYNYYCSYWNE